MPVIEIPWEDASGESISIESQAQEGDQTLYITSPLNIAASARSKEIVLQSTSDPTKKAYIQVSQPASVYTYVFTLAANQDMLPAAGGVAYITGQLQTFRNGSLVATDEVVPQLSGASTGFSISGTQVIAASRETTIGPIRSISIEGSYSGTFDGQTVTANITISQEANAATTITYGTPTITFSYSSITAAGGKVQPTLSYLQTRTQNYTSGAVSPLTPVTSGGTTSFSAASSSQYTLDAQTGTITWKPNYSTSATEVEVTVSVTLNGETASTTAAAVQEADAPSLIIYATPSVMLAVSDIPAAGGTISSGSVTYSQSRTQVYVSGKTEELAPLTSGAEVTYGDPVSAANLGSTIQNRQRVGTLAVYVTMNGEQGTTSSAVYQAENKVTEIALNGGAYSYPFAPAAGGAVTPNFSYPDIVFTYSSGASGGTIPDNEFGTYSVTAKYSYGGDNNFTSSLDADSGVVVVNSRGVVAGPVRSLGLFNATATAIWAPSVGYPSDTLTQDQAYQTTCLQQSNWIESLSIDTIGSLSYPIALPSGGVMEPSTSRGSVFYNYASGEQASEPQPGEGSVTSAQAYSWEGAQGNFTNLDGESGEVTVATCGTSIIAPQESPVITLAATTTFTPNEGTFTENLINGSKLVELTTAMTNWKHVRIPINEEVASGDEFSISIESIEGTAGSYSVVLYNDTGDTRLSDRYELTSTNRTAVFKVFDTVQGSIKAGLVLYAGVTGSTLGQSATYHNIMLVRGTTPMPYAPSLADATVSVTDNIQATTGQESNYITAITPAAGSCTYGQAPASGGTLLPNLTKGALTFTYASGATGTNVPAEEDGVLDDVISYSWAGPTGNYLSLNPDTGAVEVASAGTVASGGTSSPTITVSRSLRWTPTMQSPNLLTDSRVFTSWIQAINPFNGEEVDVAGYPCMRLTYPNDSSGGYANGKFRRVDVEVGQTYNVSVWAYSTKEGSTAQYGFEGYPSIFKQFGATELNRWILLTGTFEALQDNYTYVSYCYLTANGQNIALRNAQVQKGALSIWQPSNEDMIIEASTSLQTSASQAANIKSYGAITIASFSYPNAEQLGETVLPVVGAVTQATSFTSGATSRDTINARQYSIPSPVSGASVDSTTGALTWAENTGTSSRSVEVRLTVAANGKNATKDATCTQDAGARTYSDITITAFTYNDIAAGGGSVVPVITYSQTYGWNGATTGGGTITSGASLSYSGSGVNSSTGAVSAASLGTTVKSRAAITTASVTVSLNGKTASTSVTVYQAANVATYGTVTISGGSVSDIPASGGSVSSASGISATQTVSYTSGSTRAGSVSISYSTAVSAASLGTTVKARTSVGTLKATGTGEGNKTASKSFTVYQAANSATYGDVTITGGSVSDIPASGGSVSSASGISATQTVSYTSGSTRAGSVSISYSTAVSAASLGTTVKARTSVGTLKATAAGEGSKTATKSFTVYQAANAATTITYGVPTVTLTVSDIPAAGGTISSGSVTYSQSRTQNYTSGASAALSAVTSGGSISYSAAVTAASLGTTIKSRTAVGTLTATVSLNGKSGSDSVTVYQAANAATTISYGSWKVSITAANYTSSTNACSAAGGSTTLSSSAYRTRTQNYTSGATSSLSNETAAPALSITGAGASLSGSTATWASRGTTTGSVRSATITATYKSVSATEVIYQAANSIVSYNYGAWGVSLQVVPTTFTAAGGTATVTTSASRTKTPVYSSGATGSQGTESATPTVTVTGTGFSYSGGKVTVAAQTATSSRSGVVKATYSSASKSVTITQAGADAFVTVAPTSITFTQRADSATVAVSSNTPWSSKI